MNLGDQRDLFEIPEGISYLNCAYMGPQLRSAREIGERAVGRKSRPWEITRRDAVDEGVGGGGRWGAWGVPPGVFLDEVGGCRGLFARLVGGGPDGVAVLPSVSYGM